MLGKKFGGALNSTINARSFSMVVDEPAANDSKQLSELISTKFSSLESMIRDIATGLKTLQTEVSQIKMDRN